MWWLVLSEESRERAEAELDKQNIQLQQEIAERKRAEIALQELAQELEIRVEQRTAELSEALQNLRDRNFHGEPLTVLSFYKHSTKLL
ncbi:hypothetical protein [Okeania sp. SIO2B3]|uniref:hypothetical protein n=1 Tax=Okeania sp. SIO2B3 TaxID=2607784 RepID=UPI0025CCD6D7|nr:hypothetical protein [Okeania sp. SIO2B3]